MSPVLAGQLVLLKEYMSNLMVLETKLWQVAVNIWDIFQSGFTWNVKNLWKKIYCYAV